jgi:osmotically-inducible protein OsmY
MRGVMKTRFRQHVLLVATLAGAFIILSARAEANPGVDSEPRVEGSQQGVRTVDHVLREVKKQVKGSRYSIKVTDLDDVLLLEGEVDSEKARQEIVAIASSIASKRVNDELRIRPAISDEQIAERVKQALLRDYPSVAKKVQIGVTDGVARLSGDLRNHREVDELLSTTLMVEGVKDVKSDITIGGRAYYGQRQRAGR